MAPETDWIALCLAGGDMSHDEAAKLEAKLADEPDDLHARVKLLGYYFLSRPPRRDEHVLWVIAHHPELDLAGFIGIVEPLSPDAYAEAVRLWKAAIARQPENATILRHASSFVMGDHALAEQWLRRGALLEPMEPRWHSQLALRHRLDNEPAKALAEYELALALETSPVGRYGALIDLAKAAFSTRDYERAAAYAERVLAEAEAVRGTWIYGNGIHTGHIVLGHVALVHDDVARAREHLAAAGATPGSPQLNSFGPDQDLAVELLARGERAAVIEYADAVRRFYSGALGMIGAAFREP